MATQQKALLRTPEEISEAYSQLDSEHAYRISKGDWRGAEELLDQLLDFEEIYANYLRKDI